MQEAPEVQRFIIVVKMYLATDYIHPFEGDVGVRSRCRLRLYLPYEAKDAAVVICSELPDNPGEAPTNAAEQIAAEVITHFKFPSPPVWIEHRPPEATDGEEEGFDLVNFAHYEVRKTIRGGTLRKEIGPASRKPLDRRTVEMLVGRDV
ncbi:MAG: hypothetical protein AVDCRST_MAG78-120 [uncultured Rubrobacteraceae bacterium]|uniref:Uncharacterized protein n=1 Tax=uncultured Rubrobacteraceae bacterium TaxID=349277 RepID=A0A6J4P5D5_9ACTN|nr:MAG: hypothetical protein AVDCRST_MAG78-120 [uncultured Rubrobacteraceae bacterium]